MINKINCQNDTELQKFSQLTQPGRNFWLCFNVLREFSDESVNSGKEGCWLYLISKESSSYLLRVESRTQFLHCNFLQMYFDINIS